MKFNRPCRARSLAFSILISFIFVAADTPKTQQKDEIRAVGRFTNVQSEGEHDNGYSVQLWCRAGTIIGLIDYYCGLEGDPPMGLLTDVRYDSLTGKLLFKAKLTSGLHYCSVHKDVPSHDLLSFQGVLKADSLEGEIVLEDQLDSPPGVVDTRHDFLMRRDNDFKLANYENYEIWWRNWEPVFKRRGPKW